MTVVVVAMLSVGIALAASSAGDRFVFVAASTAGTGCSYGSGTQFVVANIHN